MGQYIPLIYHLCTTYILLIYCLHTAPPSLPVYKNRHFHHHHCTTGTVVPFCVNICQKFFENRSPKGKNRDFFHFFLRVPPGTPNTWTLEEQQTSQDYLSAYLRPADTKIQPKKSLIHGVQQQFYQKIDLGIST